MTHLLRSLLALSLLSLAACAADPGEGVAPATVAEPAPEAAAEAAPEAPAAAAGVERAIDVSASRVHALGAKVTKQHDIVWKGFDGSLTLDGDQVVGLSVTVDMNTLEADAEKLTGHLKSDDFFDVASHPTATFVSTSVTAGTNIVGATHMVEGDMTIAGKTKRLTFPVTISTEGGAVSAKAEFVIDRRDFDVTYPGRPDDLIKDNVAMTIELVAPAG